MPKLDGTQLVERLQRRLDELLRGDDVAARDLKALLTDNQISELDMAWGRQQALRKEKRARTLEEQAALGWKSKREVQIEVLKRALAEAEENELSSIEERFNKANVRQAKIFLQSYSEARAAGKDSTAALTAANNDLTRAGLARLDGLRVNTHIKRDEEVAELERKLQSELGLDVNGE